MPTDDRDRDQGYAIERQGDTFQRSTTEQCPRCAGALSLMNYGGIPTLVCENVECGRNGFYWRHAP